MAITIRILKQVTVSPGGSFPDTITAEFAIQNDAVSSTWYRWSRGGIPGNTADVPAFLAAEGASLYTDAAAGGVTMTADQVNAGVYAWQHFAYRDIFDIASYLLGQGGYDLATPPTAPTTVAKRTMLSSVATYLLNNLGSTPFERSFINERSMAQATGTISTMTDAQLATYRAFIGGWIGDRIDNANKAAKLLGL
jgi:hypothetical protein